MIKLIRKLASRRTSRCEDRRGDAPHGILVQTLQSELAYHDTILRVLSGSRH